MMASSCYDPDAAVGLWGRMEQEEEVKVPQFMSTHPSSHNRMEKMREWSVGPTSLHLLIILLNYCIRLPEAHEKRNDAQCGITTGYGMILTYIHGSSTDCPQPMTSDARSKTV